MIYVGILHSSPIAIYKSVLKFSAHGASSNRRLTGHGGDTNLLTPCALWIPQMASTSSSSSATIFAFSSIREGVTDFGIATMPRATRQVH